MLLRETLGFSSTLAHLVRWLQLSCPMKLMFFFRLRIYPQVRMLLSSSNYSCACVEYSWCINWK